MSSAQHTISLPRILLLVLAILLGAWFLHAFSGEAREYQRYFSEDRPAIDLRYDELAGDWTEQALKARFQGQALPCFSDAPVGLGDRVCTLNVFSNRGVPTLFISFFFDKGRLKAASFNIPWWSHGKALDDIVATYGEPYAAQEEAYSGVRLMGWKLPGGGALFYNRDRDINPMIWNAVFWNSAESCAGTRCFADGTYSRP